MASVPRLYLRSSNLLRTHLDQRSQLVLLKSSSPLTSSSWRNHPHTSSSSSSSTTRVHLRTFSTTQRLALSGRGVTPSARNNNPSQAMMMAKQQAEATQSGDILEYLGLLENTFIMPRYNRKPSNVWEAVRLQFHGLVTRFFELAQNIWLSKFYVKPRVKILESRREAREFAKQIYLQVNRAVAKGDLYGLEGKLSGGFREKLKGRIGKREGGMKWDLIKWLGEPKVVSWRFVSFPASKETPKNERHGIVQAVVRMRSKQCLLRTKRMQVPKTAKGPAKVMDVVIDVEGKEIVRAHDIMQERVRRQRDVTEYFVVQRLLKKGILGPWTAWGTADETTMEMVTEEKAKLMSQRLAMGQQK